MIKENVLAANATSSLTTLALVSMQKAAAETIGNLSNIDRLPLWTGEKILSDFSKICRIGAENFTICRDYCCGEFWELNWGYCCNNDFKPLRNLLSYLVITLVIQFLGLLGFIMIEKLVEIIIRRKLTLLLKDLPQPEANSFLTDLTSIYRDPLSSNDTTVDDDQSLEDGSSGKYTNDGAIRKQNFDRHSQSFKDMTRASSQRKSRRLAMLRKNRNQPSPGDDNNFNGQNLNNNNDDDVNNTSSDVINHKTKKTIGSRKIT